MAQVAAWVFGTDNVPSFDGKSTYAEIPAKGAFCGVAGALQFQFVASGAAQAGSDDAVLFAIASHAEPVPSVLITVSPAGAVSLSAGGAVCAEGYQIQTPDGFCAVGDAVSVTMSWQPGGGGQFAVSNLDASTSEAAVLTAPMPAEFSLEPVAEASFYFGATPVDGKMGGFFEGSISEARAFNLASDGIVEGTDGNDTIDARYLGDPDGDRIDAILPGAAPNDDLVMAGAGNDNVNAGLGDDTVFGEDGNDTLRGGDGDDILDVGAGNDTGFGDAGNDTLIGGEGRDVLFGGDDRDTFTNVGAGDVVDGDEGGDDFDVLDLTGQGPFEIKYTGNSGESGFVYFLDDEGNRTGQLRFRDIEKIVPCFTPGCLIATPTGTRRVETLKAGDKVITRDNGLQEIRWIGTKTLNWETLRANAHLKPILIRKGALGDNLPDRDMQVSPNHRLLVANDRTSLYFEDHEVLAAAKHLVNNQGIHEVEALGVTYIHFMFDRHEVVLADGVWTESFQPGDYTLRGIGNAQRTEIFDLFPDLKTAEGIASFGAARRSLKRHEAKLIMDRFPRR